MVRLLFVVCIAALAAPVAAQPLSPAPLTSEQQLDFLRTAEIIKATPSRRSLLLDRSSTL